MRHLFLALAFLIAPVAAAQPTMDWVAATEVLSTNQEARFPEARAALEAAAPTNAEAMGNLASMLDFGLGGPEDRPRARQLREQAAAQGSIGANMTLSSRYRRGEDGYPQDASRALAHMRAAAESQFPYSGRALAQWRLAMMYLRGVGTPPNEQEAYRWVVRSSDAGDINGMVSRAVMLATAEGVAEDDVQARVWYQRASESGRAGSAHALRGLGGMLFTGEGGAVDQTRGYAYIALAAQAGDRQASEMLSLFAAQFTPSVRDAAEPIAREWLASHPRPLPDEEFD